MSFLIPFLLIGALLVGVGVGMSVKSSGQPMVPEHPALDGPLGVIVSAGRHLR